MYRELARYYDWPGALDFTGVVAGRVQEMLARAGIVPPGPILDLACGTGTLALALAAKGWAVIGLDNAPAMLALAREKAGPQAVTWIEADMRDFSLAEPVAAVLCTSDSLNHLLTPADLARTLDAVCRSLFPGGLFVFDLNTEALYQALWTGRDVSESPNARLLFDNAYDTHNGRATAHITAQEHTARGLVETVETVTEQYYDEGTVRDLLARAGFEAVVASPFNPLALPGFDEATPQKTLWSARRSPGHSHELLQ